ncbi:MAG TPA: branched-chain amino acid ABC transporter permease [Candidatus Dormibacteraeota bacterium]|nr:branched-chain amino acid ABC transporter permease [Candidatus Dormibacteraeota bacterium]
MDFFVQLFTDPASFYSGHELLIAQMGVNSLLAISIFVTLYAGQLTLAQVGFMAIGAYTSVILNIDARLPLAVGAVAGSLLAAVAALIIGLPVLRLRGIFLAIATLGFGEAFRFGVLLNLPITGEGQGLTNTGADIEGGIVPVWISVVILTYLIFCLTRSRTGRAWAAMREDEAAAASQGINVVAMKMAAFLLGALIAGYAGALDAHLSFFVDPTEYATPRAVGVLIFAVVGGTGFVLGPVVGAIFLTALPEILRFAADYRDAVNGLILLLIIIFRPQGLVSRGGLAIIRPRWWPLARS